MTWPITAVLAGIAASTISSIAARHYLQQHWDIAICVMVDYILHFSQKVSICIEYFVIEPNSHLESV